MSAIRNTSGLGDVDRFGDIRCGLSRRALRSVDDERFCAQPIPIIEPWAAVAAWWLAFTRMKTGRSDRYWFWGVAGIFTFSAIGNITSAAETLLRQLTNL